MNARDEERHQVRIRVRRRRLLQGALVVAVAASALGVVRSIGTTAGAFMLVVTAVALLALALLQRDDLPLRAVELLLLLGTAVPAVGYQVVSVAQDVAPAGAAGTYYLLLQGFRVSAAVATAVCFVLPPRQSLAAGVATVALSIGAVPVLRDVDAGDAGVVVQTLLVSLLVVAFAHVLAHSSSLLVDRTISADRALEDRRELQAIAAHDLRSPLAVASGALQTMAVHRDKLDEDQYADLLRVADDAVRRAAALSDDLLEESFAHPNGVLPREVRVGDVVADAVAMSVLPADDVRVEGGDVRVVVAADRLQRIVTNLLDNAARHGQAPVEVTASAQDGAWTLTVRDHGQGIGAGFVDVAFEPFTRDATASTRDGVGLGLHIVAAFVRSLGGTVRVEDADPGARFVVTLPQHAAQG